MSEPSTTAISVMVIVIVLCLIFLIAATTIASRRPYFRHRRREPMPAGVRGGRHVAVGGRSVMPHRTAPVLPLQTPQAQVDAQEESWEEVAADQASGQAEVPAGAVPQARLRQGSVPVPRKDEEPAAQTVQEKRD
jgi:hypothetical protein